MHACAECGRPITVFIGEPSGLDWKFRPFCDGCRRRLATGAACPRCNTSYADFLDRGRLGCATCYTVHARRLHLLLEPIRSPVAARSRRTDLDENREIDRMARVRTDELHALLEGEAAEQEPADRPDLSVDAAGRWRSPGRSEPEPAEDPVILSVRLRVARNLSGLRYYSRPERLRPLAAILLAPGSILARRRAAAAAVAPDSPGARVAFLVGDEDHLRCEWVFPFRGPDDLYQRVHALKSEVAELDRLYLWQHHRDFGYLTACPANSGSGLRLSFRLSVPRLLAGGNWSLWRRELEKAGLEVRGPAGEGSRPGGGQAVLEISNRNWPAGTDLAEECGRIFAILSRITGQERSGG